METNVIDLILIFSIVISGSLALFQGFFKELLALLGWFVAFINIKIFFTHLSKPLVIFIENESLRDIQESIDSLDQIIKEERNSKLTIVLFILTFLGVFSAFNDMMDLFEIKGLYSPHFIWVVLGVLAIISVSILGKNKR